MDNQNQNPYGNQTMPPGYPQQQGQPMQQQPQQGYAPQGYAPQPGYQQPPNYGPPPGTPYQQPGPQGMPPQQQAQQPQMGGGGGNDFAFGEDYIEVTPDIGEGKYDFEVMFKEIKTFAGKKDVSKTWRQVVYTFKVVGGQHEGKQLSKQFSVDFAAELRKFLDTCGTQWQARQAADGKREGFNPRSVDGAKVSAEVYLRDGQYLDLKEFAPIATNNPQPQPQMQQQQQQPPPQGQAQGQGQMPPGGGGWQ